MRELIHQHYNDREWRLVEHSHETETLADHAGRHAHLDAGLSAAIVHEWTHVQRVVLSGQQLFLAVCASCDAVELTTDAGSRAIVNPYGLIEVVRS